jgi:NitT/TauT family transport system ATP-binding protein
MTGGAIRVASVSKVFAGGDGIPALTDVSIDIAPGEFVVLLGPSGCGKTTLLRIIGGLSAATGGRVEVGGGRSTRDGAQRARADIGFVFQEPNLLPWRDVRRNIELPLELRGVPSRERRRTAEAMLELVQLERFATAYPRQLSGGMRQRVAIARALSYDPGVLLLDEPFGALDAQTRDGMNLELQRIWLESGKTVVLVTHSIPEAAFLADRVVLLSANPGRVAAVENVDFGRPRAIDLLEQPEFLSIVARLRTHLGDR